MKQNSRLLTNAIYYRASAKCEENSTEMKGQNNMPIKSAIIREAYAGDIPENHTENYVDNWRVFDGYKFYRVSYLNNDQTK